MVIFSAIVHLGLLAAATLVSAVPLDAQQTVIHLQGVGDVITKCTVPNTVALTFDDGPYLYTYDIVGALNAAGVKGTFFFNGNNYGCIYSGDNPDKIRYVVNSGHQAASHTWAHKDLTTLNWDMIHDECWRVEQALLRIAGVYPAFMRPPYGSYNDLVHQVATVRNQSLVLWDLDAGDGLGKSPEESQRIYDEVISRHPSTILALNHETHERTAHQVLWYAIQRLKSAGYVLVTLAECVGQAPYQYVTNPQQGTWTC